jgi:hypothetical protein
MPTRRQRADAATRLWNTVYPGFPDEEPDTALFLLEESKRSYDGWVESDARIEAKATWLTGFLAGGAGLLTIFGSARGDKSQIQPGQFARTRASATMSRRSSRSQRRRAFM